MKRVSLAVFVVSLALGLDAKSQTPFSGATELGVPFPLPQATNAYGRRTGFGESNALTISWDGRLIMYFDTGNPLWQNKPANTNARGYLFATFDPTAVTLDGSGRPSFGNCIGTPFPRFAEVSDTYQPFDNLNNYPQYTGYIGGPYPLIAQSAQGVGSLGELGLHHGDQLSNNMYPVPDGELPSGAYGHNPFKSGANGTPDLAGAYLTYRAYVTFQDIPKFWDAALNQWRGYTDTYSSKYEVGTYPNHIAVDPCCQFIAQKRNGISKLEITVDPQAHTVIDVRVLQKWNPFRVVGDGTWTPASATITSGLSIPNTSNVEMWADTFEPILTNDGHLMVGKAFPTLVTPTGQTTNVVFFYNQTAFADGGWEGPWQFHQLYLKRNVSLAGQTIAERYPISRHAIKDYDGSVLGDGAGGGTVDGILTGPEARASNFEGGYTWLDPDGRYLIYAVYTAGVPQGHPETLVPDDGGSISNRSQASIVGSVTGWQMWRIDHAVENPSRHLYTAWDEESRTTHLRVASFGFGPGFWEQLRGAAGLPLRNDGRMKLQLVQSQRRLYYELDLSPYQERDYGFYLPMTEMLYFRPSPPAAPMHRDVDITRTPDLSGNKHFAYVEGGQLPCEYFDLPTRINSDAAGNASIPGLYSAAATLADIQTGTGTALPWSAGEVVQGHSGYWIKIADALGKDACPPDSAPPYSVPHFGRGNVHDMDSDECWGRVGQAMFFKQSTKVRVSNAGTPPELNPGTSVSGSAREFTVSLWIHPLQNRTARVGVFTHNLTLSLTKFGGLEATVTGYPTLSSPAGVAPNNAWTHVAVTWKDTPATSQSELRLYVNGSEVAASPSLLGTDNLALNSGDINIGCLGNVATSVNDAVFLLDEVALKNRALFGKDIGDLALAPITTPTWNNSNLPAAPAPFNNATDARVPTSNPYDATVAQLGADLFRDVQLSSTKTMSCASCHIPTGAFVENTTLAHGIGGLELLRNTPTIYNQRFQTTQFWDARAVDLEDQAADPIFEPTEMNLTWANVQTYLTGDADYNTRFNASYPGTGVTETNLRKALATYMRAPTAGASPADQFNAGTITALSASAIRGRALFGGRARCSGCHNGPNFTDGRLWTTGTFRNDHWDDGAYNANASPSTAGRARFLGAFKTPTLRELKRTGPYFHDGHAAKLDDVVAFYNAGGVRQDAIHPGYALDQAGHDLVAEEINHKLGLSANEITDLVAYLEALTAGPTGSVNDGPTGLDHAPAVKINQLLYATSGGGQVVSVTIDADITDAEGQSDLDVGMNWTLEMEVNNVKHYWSEGTLASITNGYRIVATIACGPAVPTVRVRAADHHGRWGAWAY